MCITFFIILNPLLKAGRDFFWCSQGPNFVPMEIRCPFAQFLKKNKKKLFRPNTHHTSYMVTIYYLCILFLLQFYGNIVCIIANLFFTVIMHYNKGLGSRRGEISPAIEMHTNLKYVYMVYFIEKKSKFYLPRA